MRSIADDVDLTLQVVVTGMHLAAEFGCTYRSVEADGFRIDHKVEMLQEEQGDTAVERSIAAGLVAFTDVFRELRPDIVVLLGDRFELLSPAIAAYFAQIPIAHIHGGETTQGAIDEGVRHAVTKLASLHFAATEAYRRRIIQMGEDPARVFCVGAPGLDALDELELLSRTQLESRLAFDLARPVAIVTYHPVTLERRCAERQIDALLSALSREKVRALFTKANADPEGRVVNAKVADYCRGHPVDYRLFDSLGQMVYLNCLRHVDLMVGNSSSGLIEAPSFSLPVVNVGDRQRGRSRAANVIDVGYDSSQIAAGIRKALSPGWRAGLEHMDNPYEQGGQSAGLRIKQELRRADLGPGLLRKRFYDIPPNVEPGIDHEEVSR